MRTPASCSAPWCWRRCGRHDLTHLDAYTAATRLVADGRQTPAFTVRTRPAKPVIGEATAIRQAAAAAITPQGANAIDDLVNRYSHPDQADTNTSASTASTGGRNGDTTKRGSRKTGNS